MGWSYGWDLGVSGKVGHANIKPPHQLPSAHPLRTGKRSPAAAPLPALDAGGVTGMASFRTFFFPGMQ